jgi:hypothetical protein
MGRAHESTLNLSKSAKKTWASTRNASRLSVECQLNASKKPFNKDQNEWKMNGKKGAKNGRRKIGKSEGLLLPGAPRTPWTQLLSCDRKCLTIVIGICSD